MLMSNRARTAAEERDRNRKRKSGQPTSRRRPRVKKAEMGSGEQKKASGGGRGLAPSRAESRLAERLQRNAAMAKKRRDDKAKRDKASAERKAQSQSIQKGKQATGGDGGKGTIVKGSAPAARTSKLRKPGTQPAPPPQTTKTRVGGRKPKPTVLMGRAGGGSATKPAPKPTPKEAEIGNLHDPRHAGKTKVKAKEKGRTSLTAKQFNAMSPSERVKASNTKGGGVRKRMGANKKIGRKTAPWPKKK